MASHNSPNAATYYGNGFKYPGQVKEGMGFRKGDMVETVVDLTDGKV